ncbi:MAG: hypothetical protein ACK5JT_22245 [Hyphomicrobiaceae bacterium]
MRDSTPNHIDPSQWQQSLGLSRQICARVFRDGGTPNQALLAIGIEPHADMSWDKAVELVAEAMSSQQLARAA